MSRPLHWWWTELTGDGRPWSLRHPVEQARHLAFLVRARNAIGAADALSARLVSTWDRDAFIERFRPYWDPFPTKGAPKYLDLDRFLRDSAIRPFALGLFPDGRPLRVLDVGSGPGYFLSMCRELGHEVVGVDLDDEPLYNDLIEIQALTRIVHTVTPDAPLPQLEGQVDLVTAFGVTFSFTAGPGGGSWSVVEWMRAIDAFVAVLAPGGRVVIHFNQDPGTGRLFPRGLRRRLGRRRDLRPRFFGEYLVIEYPGPSSGRQSR